MAITGFMSLGIKEEEKIGDHFLFNANYIGIHEGTHSTI